MANLLSNHRRAALFSCCLALLVGLLLASRASQCAAQETSTNAVDVPATSGYLEPTVDDQAMIERADTLAKSVATTDWLGALSPIAVSPFFGMACLSGVATYGPDWLKDRSSLFGDTSPLANPYLFWSMVVLTVLTSIPRFSKVSKPLAMVADKLETYSVIIILIGIRIFGGLSDQPIPELETPGLQAAGIASLPLDLVLAAFAWVNLVVVGTIKLFFELLIWLTPIPAVDAMLEAANKIIVAGFTAIYCASPFAAAVLNVVILGVCCSVFFWVSRRLHYYLRVYAWPWFMRLLGKRPPFEVNREALFLANAWGAWPLYTQVNVIGSDAAGWTIHGKRWGLFRTSAAIGPAAIIQESDALRSRLVIDDGRNPPLHVYVRKL